MHVGQNCYTALCIGNCFPSFPNAQAKGFASTAVAIFSKQMMTPGEVRQGVSENPRRYLQKNSHDAPFLSKGNALSRETRFS